MIICYGLALAMIVLLFIFYTTPNKCETNKARKRQYQRDNRAIALHFYVVIVQNPLLRPS